MSSLLSAACLAVVGLLCIVGVFHPRYKDTLLERIGMSLVGLWCLARIAVKVSAGEQTEPVHLLLHVGLACFAVGMAAAKWRSRHCDCNEPKTAA
jgi:hypothetical protein